MKTALLILSDPRSGSEEALGRLFNALAAAYDLKTRGDEVAVYFQGAGTRWLGALQAPDHPARQLFDAVSDTVVGASCGCADVFGAREEVEQTGFDLITDNAVPGTTGLPSVAQMLADGYQVVTF